MSFKLPIVSGIKVVKALHKFGFLVDHQTGSHFVLRLTKAPFSRLVVPNHRALAKGTLRAIIRQSKIPKDVFLRVLKGI